MGIVEVAAVAVVVTAGVDPVDVCVDAVGKVVVVGTLVPAVVDVP